LEEIQDGNGQYSFQEFCDQWVNFTSFRARWLEAGLNDRSSKRCHHSIHDISVALEENMPFGPRRECLLLVAAHYILLAGRILANDCLKKIPNNFGPDKWTRWAEKFGQISRQEPENTRLASATKAASEYMLSLRQEILC
jgi:hypothetical protein